MRRKVSIFGSTGSIGCNTVSLIEAQGGAEAYEVVAVTGATNLSLLAEQAVRLKAKYAVTSIPSKLTDLQSLLYGSGITSLAGPEGLLEAARVPVDWTMSAIVGFAGLAPGLESARHGGVIALANKESLVCAGDLFMRTCREHGTELLPVDSEHSAIYQALCGEKMSEVERIILTASGGPFREKPLADLTDVTPEQACKHPNWDMGQKISIDSASMFNKAMEVIETKYLFGIDGDRIEVVVHPQSAVHSMVGFCDGAVMAHLGPTDMRGSIGYALNWPERRPLPLEPFDLVALGRLDFAAVDHEKFPSVNLAYRALREGGLAGAVFNAAKEAALEGFIAGFIGFLDMSRLVEHVMDEIAGEAAQFGSEYDLSDVQRIDGVSRVAARSWISRHNRK
ncbi:1-deoxy-D-xylulose-5-phosphate reductoisomerase [Amaricoccus tamworthensis]|uniref:1-deoxy-D-xylulose-5-phosphate reductoisomerase n=1 Tax=Amaricoccus tamworthensis TaxID=57002 RepID=UPI003C7B686C